VHNDMVNKICLTCVSYVVENYISFSLSWHYICILSYALVADWSYMNHLVFRLAYNIA